MPCAQTTALRAQLISLERRWAASGAAARPFSKYFSSRLIVDKPVRFNPPATMTIYP